MMKLCAVAAVPFVGFGIADNFIMIVAGDSIDNHLGVSEYPIAHLTSSTWEGFSSEASSSTTRPLPAPRLHANLNDYPPASHA